MNKILSIYGMHSLDKISASINDGLDPGPETAASMGDIFTRQVSKNLINFCNERCLRVVKRSVDISLCHAPYKIIQGITVRRAGRPEFLLPEKWKIFTALMRLSLNAEMFIQAPFVNKSIILMSHIIYSIHWRVN